MPTIGAGVHGDLRGGLVDQKGDPIPELQSFEPPLYVVSEGFFKIDGVFEPGSSSLRCKYSVEKKSASKEYVAGIEELTSQAGKLLFRCFGLVKPLSEQGGEGNDLVLREGDGVGIHIILETKGDTDWARRRNVTLRGGKTQSEMGGQSKEGTEVVLGEAFR